MASKRYMIAISADTRKRLQSSKFRTETWDAFLLRLLYCEKGRIPNQALRPILLGEFRRHLRKLAVGDAISCEVDVVGVFKTLQTFRKWRSLSGHKIVFRYANRGDHFVIVATRFPDGFIGGTIGKDYEDPGFKLVQHYGIEDWTECVGYEAPSWENLTPPASLSPSN